MLSHPSHYNCFVVLVLVWKWMMPEWHDMMMTRWHSKMTWWQEVSQTIDRMVQLFPISEELQCPGRLVRAVRQQPPLRPQGSLLRRQSQLRLAAHRTARRSEENIFELKYFYGTKLFSFRCFVLCLVLSCSFYKSLHVFVPRNILSSFQMFPVDWRTCCLLL